jgi:hypothetical protein
MHQKQPSEDWPAIGDDREGAAKELLRLAELPCNAEKSGLVMQLQVAANLLCRADAAIRAMDRRMVMYRHADLGHLFCWCVENLHKFPPLQGEWTDIVKQRLLDGQEVSLWQRFASYCRCCAQSGENDPDDFGTFKRRYEEATAGKR